MSPTPTPSYTLPPYLQEKQLDKVSYYTFSVIYDLYGNSQIQPIAVFMATTLNAFGTIKLEFLPTILGSNWL